MSTPRQLVFVETPIVTPPDVTILSDRELQILKGLALGYRNREIADKIFLSKKTVDTYRSRVFEKMGFRTLSDLVQYAWRSGLVK